MNMLQRLALLMLATALTALLVHAALTHWPLPALLAGLHATWPAPAAGSPLAVALSLLLTAPVALWLAQLWLAPLARLLRALEGAVQSWREGDFSVALAPGERRAPGLSALVDLHAALAQALREQRQHLAQRELLLDSVVQHTPLALLLVDAQGRVTLANLAARQLLSGGRSLAGSDFEGLVARAPEAFRQALEARHDGLFSVALEGQDETFHLSQRDIRLHGQPHRLVLIRRLTRELAREEVASWKRVIRVISHELNNSLAPISSLAHTGRELARRGDADKLDRALAGIAERANHLHRFLEGYARVARLPAPRLEPVDWGDFLRALAAQAEFRLRGAAPAEPAAFDAPQVEQALLNLLKNAHEAGGAAAEVTLAIERAGAEWRFEVADRGPGMSEAVLAQALLPFYSTKRSGTGLGLALAREIAEAHGGRIGLANREGGGLLVTVVLP
ncbi:MAG: ATP-binding protein [Pelomonas sp.]|nr:ATP-binding protein [Roseateles sp.]